MARAVVDMLIINIALAVVSRHRLAILGLSPRTLWAGCVEGCQYSTNHAVRSK